jgi:hypothetical protein
LRLNNYVQSTGPSTDSKRLVFIRQFRAAGATDPQRAIKLSELGRQQDEVFREMRDLGVFLSAENGKFYLNEPVADEMLQLWKRSRRIKNLVLCIAMVIVFALVILQAHHQTR